MRNGRLRALLFLLFVASPASAQRLPMTAIPEHYDLAFDVDVAQARFEGIETIRVRVPEPTTRIVLHAVQITFHQVTVASGPQTQKASVALDPNTQTATLTVPRALPAGAAEIHVSYTGILNNQLRGFYLSKANGRSYAVSQLEATDARRAFPCFDEPALKATFSMTLTVDAGDTAISNGRLLSDTRGPGASRHTLKFATSPKMSSYLVAMAVGDFQCIDGGADGVPIRVCATPGKKELGRTALEAAEFILHFYNSYYSIKYPFGKLDLLAVPDFAASAMENTAAMFFRDTDLLVDSKTASVGAVKNVAEVVAHEMAHQWFGDLVTMKWWDDLWLNEGFATWMETQPLAAWKPEWNMAVDQALATERALNLDSLKSTRPIHANVETPAEIDESFDAIAYEKGAAVMRMIEGYVGTDVFRTGVNAYLEKHAYGNATSEDFWTVIASTSGKPVDQILPTFVNQPGVPVISMSLTCSPRDAGWGSTLKQQRFYLDPELMKAAAHANWAVPICLKNPDSSTSCRVFLESEPVVLGTTVSDAKCPAWLFANADARGYYRTAYSPELLRSLAPNVESVLTAPERLSLSGDEWALVRAGIHGAADYLTLASGFGQEKTSGVLTQVTTGLTFIHDYLTTAATRARYESFVRTLLRSQLTELGISSSSNDSDEQRSRRRVIIQTLGTAGNDPDVIASARTTVDRALAGGSTIDPTAADAIVNVAARYGDQTLWESFAAAARRSASPEEQYRYLYALGHFEDPALVARGLDYVLSPEVRSQNAARYIGGFLGNPAVNAQAWTFVKAHWTALQPKISVSFGDVRVVEALGSFCDAAARDDVKAFFATHKLGNASRTVDQTIERINNCIDLREKQTAAVSDWLHVP